MIRKLCPEISALGQPEGPAEVVLQGGSLREGTGRAFSLEREKANVKSQEASPGEPGEKPPVCQDLTGARVSHLFKGPAHACPRVP